MRTYLLVAAWLLGCGEMAVAQRSQARLIIYRQREFGGNSYTINVNDKKCGLLPPNRSLQLEVPPGRIKIESARDYFSDNQTLWVEALPGRTYYIKAVEEVDFLTRTLLIVSIPEQQGQRETRSLKPIGPAPY